MSQPRILIAPLDWGLGHAARCVPIIIKLLEKGAQPVIAGDGAGIKLLTAEFPDLEVFPLPSYPITYPDHRSFGWHFARKLPAMLQFYKAEHRALEDLVVKSNIQAVISDNRYGLFSRKVPAVLITHQVHLPSGFFTSIAGVVVRGMIKKFQTCWIPDFPDINALAGRLAHASPLESFAYIGPLSRFQGNSYPTGESIDVMGIATGPEPFRSKFIRELINQFRRLPGNKVIVTGMTDISAFQKEASETLEIRGLVASSQMGKLMISARNIVSRCGYSTIMDLYALGRPAVLIPTPGQPEQEYLARYHREKDHFVICEAMPENLQAAFDNINRSSFPEPQHSGAMLDRELNVLLNQLP